MIQPQVGHMDFKAFRLKIIMAKVHIMLVYCQNHHTDHFYVYMISDSTNYFSTFE